MSLMAATFQASKAWGWVASECWCWDWDWDVGCVDIPHIECFQCYQIGDLPNRYITSLNITMECTWMIQCCVQMRVNLQL